MRKTTLGLGTSKMFRINWLGEEVAAQISIWDHALARNSDLSIRGWSGGNIILLYLSFGTNTLWMRAALRILSIENLDDFLIVIASARLVQTLHYKLWKVRWKGRWFIMKKAIEFYFDERSISKVKCQVICAYRHKQIRFVWPPENFWPCLRWPAVFSANCCLDFYTKRSTVYC